ncbi:MAG: hypothetical protein RBG13Loki_0169, partial [Promethearchaeota archaeon CR_4]
MLYNGDHVETASNLNQWNQWFLDAGVVTTQVPIMSVEGNHDVGGNYWGVQFANPDNGPLMGSPPNQENDYDYWFIYANVFFISLDYNFNYGSPGSSDYAWLNATLSLAQNLRGNGTINWIVMRWHSPPYNGGTRHGEDLTIQNTLCPVIEAAGVDVVFNGHEHIYEKNAQIRNKAVITKDSLIPYSYNASVAGTIYIIAGVGGAPMTSVTSPPAYEVTHVIAYGYCLCSVTRNTTATTLQIEMRGVSHNVLDTGVKIIKCLPVVPIPPEMNPILPAISTTGLIQVNWTEVPNADNYTIYRHTSPITLLNETVIALGTVAVTDYNDVVTRDGNFYYAVTASNTIGLSTLSNCQSVNVDLPGPDAPVLTALSSPCTNGIIQLDWNAVADADNYRVYRYSSSITVINDTVTFLDAVGGTSFTDMVTRDGIFFYAVTATNETGISPLSNCQSVEVDLPGPDAPVLASIPSPNTNGIIQL